MNCPLVPDGQEGNRFVHRCPTCGRRVRSKSADPAAVKATCGVPSPLFGPGTEFRKVRIELHLDEKCGGGCAQLEAEMNVLGVAGCRQKRVELLAKLQKNAAKYGLLDWAKAGGFALWQGKPRSLEGLLDLAIQRAEYQRPSETA